MANIIPHHFPPVLHEALTVLAFGWGACLGSFLNVCIHRIPREQSIVKPRSHCPACGKLIPWYLNIPILSYLSLGGHCKFCKAHISARYMVVEVLVAALFVLAWLKYAIYPGEARVLGLAPVDDPLLIPVYWLIIVGLVMGTFIDFEHMIIPNRVTLGGIVAGIVISTLVPSLHGETHWLLSLVASSTGALFGWLLLWGIAVLGSLAFKKEAMGFGDVKLMGAIGAFTGWQGVLFTVMVSSCLGAIVGVLLLTFGSSKLQSRIPYGPYLSMAAIIWMLWGPTLRNAYISMLTISP